MNIFCKARPWRKVFLTLGVACLAALPVLAGTYRDSAHGNKDYGVNRVDIDSSYSAYATGNCAHCHEMHASLEGSEPRPVTGPSDHALFAMGFDTTRTFSPYIESDNFCFFCHNHSTGPRIINQDYSGAFGGAVPGSGPQSILEAFKQTSYHNLYDVSVFLNNSTAYSAWFSSLGNPCSACHNSHLAKRNWDVTQEGFPLLSVISRPGNSDDLWGETEVMSDHTGYEAPLAFNSGSREPAGFGQFDGSNTPDYVTFCTDCHNPGNTIWSTTLNRDLKKINWNNSINPFLDKHGTLARDGSDNNREPYSTAAVAEGNFVLSCLDCHEPHGSSNIMLLRRRINSESLEDAVISTDTMGYVCKRCHMDDLAANSGTSVANKWEYVHHLVSDAPYLSQGCSDCHVGDGGGGQLPIACGNCHGHGMNDSWVPVQATGRQTF